MFVRDRMIPNSSEEGSMCDYSLHATASRPAKIADKLITTSFVSSSTRGFAAVGEPEVAVCLLPGTEVVFDREAEYDHIFGRLLPSRCKLGSNVARFRQVNLGDPNAHHDALEFPNGRTVLVTRLRPGQQATVIQLPAGQRTTAPAAEPTSDAVVARPGPGITA
jgi:hypothetical protein